MENPCINLKSAGQAPGSDTAPLPALPGAGALNPPENAPAVATKLMECPAASFTDFLAAASEPETASAPAHRIRPQESQGKAAPKHAARTAANTQSNLSSPLMAGRAAAGGNALASTPVEPSAEGEGEAPPTPSNRQGFLWQQDGPAILEAAANPLSTFFYCLPAAAPPAATGTGAETWLQAKLQETAAPAACNGGNAESPTVSSLRPQTPDLSASPAKTMPGGKATAPARQANRAGDSAPQMAASSPSTAISTPPRFSTGSPASGQNFNTEEAIPAQPVQVPMERLPGAIDTASAPSGGLIFPAASRSAEASTLLPAGAGGNPATAPAQVGNPVHGSTPGSVPGSAPGMAKTAPSSTFPVAAPAPGASSDPNQGSAGSQDVNALAPAAGAQPTQETAQTAAAIIQTTPPRSSNGFPVDNQTFKVDEAIPPQAAQVPMERIPAALDTALTPSGDLILPADSGSPGASTLLPSGAGGDPTAAAAGANSIQETAQTTAASILTPPGYAVSFADQPTTATATAQRQNTGSIPAGTPVPLRRAPLANRPTFFAESGTSSDLVPLASEGRLGAYSTFPAPSVDPDLLAASATPVAGNLIPTILAPYPPAIAVETTNASGGFDANSAFRPMPTYAKATQPGTFLIETTAAEPSSESSSPPPATGHMGSIPGSLSSLDINTLAMPDGARVSQKTTPAAESSAPSLAVPVAGNLATSPHVLPAAQSFSAVEQSIAPAKDQPANNTEATGILAPSQNQERAQKAPDSAQAAPSLASQPAVNPATTSAGSLFSATPESTGIPNPANNESQEPNPMTGLDSSPLDTPSARNAEATKHGTSPAQQAVDMKNGAKMSQMNQEAGQNLPREAAELIPPAGSAAPTPSGKSPLKTSANTTADSAGLFLRQTPMESGVQNPNPVPETSQPGGSSGAAMAAKVSDLIANQAVDLKQGGASAMDLVVKTDRQTELHLKLRQEGNTVVVQARCEGGDWQQLSTHWESIKNALSPQGIQLAPLERTPAPEMMATTSGWDQRHKSPSQAGTDSSEQRPARRLAANGPSQISSIPTTKPGGTRTQVPADRHFESWA